MMGIDGKYGRVTLERGSIGDDEPVVVFRAQDKLLPNILKVYGILCELAGSPSHHLELIHQSTVMVKNWQKENFTKTPESVELKP
jgi:hypothetical protein